MATVGGGGDHQSPRLLSIPKEGERILAPTRRPDGTLRKPIRIRAGYVPQDEVAIYQSKGTLLRKEAQPEYPPGYDPALDAKHKTKSAKRNERKKEKKHQENDNHMLGLYLCVVSCVRLARKIAVTFFSYALL